MLGDDQDQEGTIVRYLVPREIIVSDPNSLPGAFEAGCVGITRQV
jgi:hypothetical protein